MKVEQLIIEKEKIEIINQAEQIKQKKFIGRVKVYKGQSLYELNTKTRMICRPSIEAAVDIKGDIKSKYVIRENCFYVTAINLKNAERKFIKMFSK